MMLPGCDEGDLDAKDMMWVSRRRRLGESSACDVSFAVMCVSRKVFALSASSTSHLRSLVEHQLEFWRRMTKNE